MNLSNNVRNLLSWFKANLGGNPLMGSPKVTLGHLFYWSFHANANTKKNLLPWPFHYLLRSNPLFHKVSGNTSTSVLTGNQIGKSTCSHTQWQKLQQSQEQELCSLVAKGASTNFTTTRQVYRGRNQSVI